MLLRTAVEQYRRQVALTLLVLRQAKQAWQRIDFANLDGSWPLFAAPALLTLTAAQRTAATLGAASVPAMLDEQNVDSTPQGQANAEALAGIASDGRALDTLLYEVVIATKYAIGQGASEVAALNAGQQTLDRIVSTQVADAGRVAAGIEVAVRPHIGYIRMLNPPSCARCVILAGRFYRWNAGFERHPRCDCVHIPVAEDTGDDLTTDPKFYFNSLSHAEQDRVFGQGDAQAIRDGADMNRVVNAHRGVYAAGQRLLTHELASFRGARLMPEQIYREATSREDAIRLLRQYGYI